MLLHFSKIVLVTSFHCFITNVKVRILSNRQTLHNFLYAKHTMEINQKLRGQKHRQNKTRYQNKAKLVTKPSSKQDVVSKDTEIPKETEKLNSNWHRYEELSDEEKVDEFTNFTLLAQAPVSQGGHFQFKSDKNLQSEFDFENLQKNKVFALDLHLLEGGLGTIPFHRRCGLDESYFTEDQMEEMNKRAQQNKAQFESYLKMISISKELKSQSLNEGETKSSKENLNEDDDNIEILQIATEKPSCNKIEITETVDDVIECATNSNINAVSDLKEDKEALEEWLDDILND